ncbi:hypothetical protein GCM10023314_19210 [Algibacter agarivorans]|uniref:YceI-like domain-containing protein n=1 Tax=Algibacter agarivorans TaxID=1109741 RepID=A0ABP9GJY3_9FLAO
MINALKNQNITYTAFDSDITFYASKSYSRQPLKNTFQIEASIDAYNIQIDMFKKTDKPEKGVINFQSFPEIQFRGELLEFDYSELYENESTVVLKGGIKVLCKKKQKTFLGSVKRIEDTIYLKANLSLNPYEFEFEKVLNCQKPLHSAKAISVEIMLHLKA